MKGAPRRSMRPYVLTAALLLVAVPRVRAFGRMPQLFGSRSARTRILTIRGHRNSKVESSGEARHPPRSVATKDIGKFSPGYGVEQKPIAPAKARHTYGGNKEVRENLSAVYRDLEEWDRAARHALANSLLIGLPTTSTPPGSPRAVAEVDLKMTDVEELKTETKATAKGAPVTTTTIKKTTVRSKVLRTGPRRPIDRISKVSDDVMPLWTSLCHSAELKPLKPRKFKIGGVPLVVWRATDGRLSALSDVCIHRGASLSNGWVDKGSGCIACPYHGFEFDREGSLRRSPAVAEQSKTGFSKAEPKMPSTVSYPMREENGWVSVFPRTSEETFSTRAYDQELAMEPLVYPEMEDRRFRSIAGGADIKADVNVVMENVLDLLHISYVHLFGNNNEPLPMHAEFQQSYDDGEQRLRSGKVVFRYRAGSKAWSKVVGGAQEVLVENEFHLPYTVIIRVRFGGNTKTIVANAVPKGEGDTRLNYKLYRDFAITHPQDDGPLNFAMDWVFQRLMDITLQEDKDIVESLYPEAGSGFMNARYDKHQLLYRRSVSEFKASMEEKHRTRRKEAFEDLLFDN